MNYLLDTCVVSELTKPRPNSKVLAWLKDRDEVTMFLSVLTLGEIQKGISTLGEVRRKGAVQHWLDVELPKQFAERILPISEEIALAWGRIQGETERRGYPVPTIDGLLGATAVTHNLTVVTRDVEGIQRTGARIANPWQSV
ncbi:MAG: type II toxin-antitoxin system VapC family toxin [Candidatus Hydrogenedentes bacterium]|nr:type II toxin-antitoxin system VapC family toxin [Candidatus Hydrogenedentota bacterium]